MADLTGWLTSKRCRFVDFGTRTYAFNGGNRPQCYDGVGWSYAGIANDPLLTPPSPAFTLGSTGLTGTYRYYIVPANETKITPDSRIETGIPVYWGETSPVDQAVTINGIPATHADPQVTHFWIYRNRNGYLDTGIPDLQQPEAFYYVDSVAVGVTTYADTVQDLELVSSERIDFERLYVPANKYAAVYANRLFTAVADDFTSGTVTVNATASLIDLAGATWPDGVLGGWFQKDGDAKKYRIARRTSTTQILLEEDFVGALSGDTYKIFRDNYVLTFSKWLDAEGNGRDGEENRFYLEVPESRDITGIIEYLNRLLVFTIDRCFFVTATDDDTPDVVTMSEEPIWVGMGAVGGDAICVADGKVYFLSLRGLCVWDGQGQPKLLDGLGADWTDALAPAQFEYCSVAQDPYNGEIVCSVPGAGETENSLEYSYDPLTNGYWPDRHNHPGVFETTRDEDGRPVLIYSQGNFVIQRSRGTNDLVPSGTVAGTVTSTTTLTATDSTAAFFTTGSGLAEAYVHFFDPTTFAHKGSRRIVSNTATELTWSSTGAGGGVLTLVAGDLYTVGAIWWYWKTPHICVPAHAQEGLIAYYGIEPDASTDRTIYLTETRDGTDKAIKRLLANKRFEQTALVQQARTFQLTLESRETNSTMSVRDLLVEREVRGGTQ